MFISVFYRWAKSRPARCAVANCILPPTIVFLDKYDQMILFFR